MTKTQIADADGVGRKDVYTKVTERIISDLEQGIRPWMKPWRAEHAAGRITKPLRHNGTPYRGMNILLLWGEAMAKGYAAPIWMTYKQAQELGANVRKGEHGSLVVYANSIRQDRNQREGEDVEREIPFHEGYTVSNVEQVDGLPAHYYAQPENPLPLSERIAHAEAFITGTGATIQHGGNSAFYAPSRDAVQLPPFEAFKDKESYYATGLHELTHWTKAKHRLDRDFSAKRFGDHGYAGEELVAELGPAFLCAVLGITPDVREDHAACLGHWLTVLKERQAGDLRRGVPCATRRRFLNRPAAEAGERGGVRRAGGVAAPASVISIGWAPPRSRGVTNPCEPHVGRHESGCFPIVASCEKPSTIRPVVAKQLRYVVVVGNGKEANAMSDPLTIGALASLVLSMGSEAALKGVVGEAVKDAYKALRTRSRTGRAEMSKPLNAIRLGSEARSRCRGC